MSITVESRPCSGCGTGLSAPVLATPTPHGHSPSRLRKRSSLTHIRPAQSGIAVQFRQLPGLHSILLEKDVTQRGVLRDRIDVGASDAELYRKYAEELTRFATGLVGPSDAADVVSEAVLRCLSSPQWTGVRQPRAYLYRSVLNEAGRFHRGNRRRRSREERSATPEVVSQPELRPEVLAAVNRLSLRQRAVIVLTYWDDLKPGAIAELLHISEGSVQRHLARGRRRLKEVLHADS